VDYGVYACRTILFFRVGQPVEQDQEPRSHKPKAREHVKSSSRSEDDRARSQSRPSPDMIASSPQSATDGRLARAISSSRTTRRAGRAGRRALPHVGRAKRIGLTGPRGCRQEHARPGRISRSSSAPRRGPRRDRRGHDEPLTGGSPTRRPDPHGPCRDRPGVFISSNAKAGLLGGLSRSEPRQRTCSTPFGRDGCGAHGDRGSPEAR